MNWKGRCRRVSLCESRHYIQKNISLPEHAVNRTHTHHMRKGTHACACLHGSYTLEAAVVLPLLTGFFVFLLFFFRVLQVQTGVQSALCYAARKTACEAGALDSEAALFASAEVYFQKEAGECEAVSDYVAGGSLGVSLLESDFSGNYVNLRANYFVKLPINFFSVKGIAISQGEMSRKWTGDAQDETAEDYVYVTEHGSVYHRSRTCRYLDLSIRSVDAAAVAELRNKGGSKYEACSVCAAKHPNANRVYITDYGVCYHSDLSCSGLKRTIYLIPLSEAGARGACSKCGGAAEE